MEIKIENAETFKKFLSERFGVVFPHEILLSDTKGHGIRVHSRGLMGNVYGLKGFQAYSGKNGINPYFMQLVGMHAKKNLIALNEVDAKKFIAGETVRKKIKILGGQGPVIVAHGGHILGVGHFENGELRSPFSQDRRSRIIQNRIKGWIGRDL
ncbi:TPA: hypothetical protein HA238_04365 [Candidatus Micrarchaeota archaeon]|nr:hypothetical protein [Candidatus Micrarchaeota archaeon]